MSTYLLDTTVIIDAFNNEKKGRRLLLRENELTLVTDNLKDFPMAKLSLYPLPSS
jgi:predicted nucleic acid-binding protein